MSACLNAARTASTLIRAGFNVRTAIRRDDNGRFYPSDLVATRGIAVVSACHNGGSHDQLVCLHVQRVDEKSDSQTDYFPGSYFDSLKRAIQHAEHLAKAW